MAPGRAHGHGRGHHDGDVEVGQRAQQSGEGQDRGGRYGAGRPAGDEEAGRQPKRPEAVRQHRAAHDRGQGHERPESRPGGRQHGCGPQRDSDRDEDGGRRPNDGHRRIFK